MRRLLKQEDRFARCRHILLGSPRKSLVTNDDSKVVMFSGSLSFVTLASKEYRGPVHPSILSALGIKQV